MDIFWNCTLRNRNGIQANRMVFRLTEMHASLHLSHTQIFITLFLSFTEYFTALGEFFSCLAIF